MTALSDDQIECYTVDAIGAVEWFFKRLEKFDAVTHGSIESVTTNWKTDMVKVVKTFWEGHCSSCYEQSSKQYDIPYSVFFSKADLEDWLKEEAQKEADKAAEAALKQQAKALKDAEELAEKQRVAKEASEYAIYLKVKERIETNG